MKIFKNKLAVTIVVLSVTFLVLISQSIKRDKMSFMGNGIGLTFNSIQGGIYSFNNKIKDSISFIFNFTNVKNENVELTKKNNDLENKLLEYNSVKGENKTLREMLNFKKEKSDYEYIGCDIVCKSGNSFLDQFIINRGSKDGIEKQMVAITTQGLVGQVIAVGNNSAIVQTISNENLAISASIENGNQDAGGVGIVKGYKTNDSKLLAKMYFLPIDSNIKKGDVILTSGLENRYPAGLRIGSVIDVEEDKGKVMKNAVVKPYVDFNKLQELLIVVPKSKSKIDVKY